jgi:hypothetical protein
VKFVLIFFLISSDTDCGRVCYSAAVTVPSCDRRAVVLNRPVFQFAVPIGPETSVCPRPVDLSDQM